MGEDGPVVDGVVEQGPGSSETAEVQGAPDVRFTIYTNEQMSRVSMVVKLDVWTSGTRDAPDSILT